MNQYPDPVLDEIRRVRREISAEVGHDLRKLADRFREVEGRFKGRKIAKPQSPPAPVKDSELAVLERS